MIVNSNKDNWTCSCETLNTGDFCGNCGSEKPPVWNCICGNINTTKFCTKCGNNKNPNVGDIVKFGRYPQTANGDIKPIEWQVFDKKNNKIFVISSSNYGLDAKRFDSSSNDWKNSEIRQWLNGDFYNNAFNEKEKKNINPFNGDNVFLLSKEEAKKYFANDESRRCKATEYAVKNGAWKSDEGYGYWWLRSMFLAQYLCVYCVDLNGSVFHDKALNDKMIVRPALWINL